MSRMFANLKVDYQKLKRQEQRSSRKQKGYYHGKQQNTKRG